MRNEAAALRFIAERTTVPVPETLDLWEENSLGYLKTALVEGAVKLGVVDTRKYSEAIDRITSHLEEEILSQIRYIRRNILGSSDPKPSSHPTTLVMGLEEEDCVWPPMERDN